MKNRTTQTLTISFSYFIHESNSKTSLIETDEGKMYVNNRLTEFLKNNDIERPCRYAFKRTVFVESFIRTFRGLFEEPAFRKRLQSGLMNKQR